MLVLARRIEHPLDVTVQRPHRTYPREHRWPMSPWQTSAARGGLKPSRPHHTPTIERRPRRCLAAPAIQPPDGVGVLHFGIRLPDGAGDSEPVNSCAASRY